MRKLLTFGAVFALAGFVAGQSTAAQFPVDGTLSVALGTLGGPSLTGSGTGDSTAAFGAATIPAGLLIQTTDLSVPINPPAIGLSKITLMAPFQNEAGSFNPGGAMGNDAVSNLFFTNNAAAGSVPLVYIGGGGSGMAKVAGLNVTIIGAEWTNLGVTAGDATKTTMIMEAPAGIPVTLTVTAFDKRTAAGKGTVQLVAPVVAKITGGALGALPVVGVLTLRYAPEPGFLLLFGTGALTLVLAGRRKRHS